MKESTKQKKLALQMKGKKTARTSRKALSKFPKSMSKKIR